MIHLSYSRDRGGDALKGPPLVNQKMDPGDQNAALISYLNLALLVRQRWIRAATQALKSPRQKAVSGVSRFT